MIIISEIEETMATSNGKIDISISNLENIEQNNVKESDTIKPINSAQSSDISEVTKDFKNTTKSFRRSVR